MEVLEQESDHIAGKVVIHTANPFNMGPRTAWSNGAADAMSSPFRRYQLEPSDCNDPTDEIVHRFHMFYNWYTI